MHSDLHQQLVSDGFLPQRIEWIVSHRSAFRRGKVLVSLDDLQDRFSVLDGHPFAVRGSIRDNTCAMRFE